MMTTFPTKERRTVLVKSDSRHWTYEDLQKMPESLDRNEIIDGVLYMWPTPHARLHQTPLGELLCLHGNWVDAHDLGEAYPAPSDVVLSPDRVLQPDVLFIRKENLHNVDAYVDCVPDLVVEVTSSETAAVDRGIKFSLYEQSGVREYWIVDPQDQSVEVYYLESRAFQLHGRFGPGDTGASRLLEGLAFDVNTIFA